MNSNTKRDESVNNVDAVQSASQYAAEVAIKTIKKRCDVLQHELKESVRENAKLRSKLQTKDDTVEKLKHKIETLERQKHQLSHHIFVVANENKTLWDNISKLTEEKDTLADKLARFVFDDQHVGEAEHADDLDGIHKDCNKNIQNINEDTFPNEDDDSDLSIITLKDSDVSDVGGDFDLLHDEKYKNKDDDLKNDEPLKTPQKD